VSDIFAVWYVIAICVGVAFLLGFVYMVLLRCCASLLVFVTLVGILLSLGGGGVWLYFMKNNYISTSENYKYCLYGAYTLWGIDGAYAIILLCLCNRIRLGVAIMKCTAQFIGSTPSVFLIPFVFSLLCAIWIAGWAFSAVFLFSVG
jgi:Plasma-membrane choline transporter